MRLDSILDAHDTWQNKQTLTREQIYHINKNGDSSEMILDQIYANQNRIRELVEEQVNIHENLMENLMENLTMGVIVSILL